MLRAEKILTENIDLLHKLSQELLEREILDSHEIDAIIRGETLPPIKKNGSQENGTEAIPDHVKKLMEQRKQKESSPKDDPN